MPLAGGTVVEHRFTDRQSKIIEILTGQSRPFAVPEMARRLDCSERTVQVLPELGVGAESHRLSIAEEMCSCAVRAACPHP